jgi:hypothetical protein
VKSVAELLSADDGEVWLKPVTWAIVLGTIAMAFGGIYVLNTALKKYESLYVVALYQSFLMLISAISGLCYFQEYKNMDSVQLSLYPLGIGIILSGVIYMNVEKARTEKGEKGQPGDDLEMDDIGTIRSENKEQSSEDDTDIDLELDEHTHPDLTTIEEGTDEEESHESYSKQQESSVSTSRHFAVPTNPAAFAHNDIPSHPKVGSLKNGSYNEVNISISATEFSQSQVLHSEQDFLEQDLADNEHSVTESVTGEDVTLTLDE